MCESEKLIVIFNWFFFLLFDKVNNTTFNDIIKLYTNKDNFFICKYSFNNSIGESYIPNYFVFVIDFCRCLATLYISISM